MKRGQLLTLEELQGLADKWFPLFNEVHDRLPDGASVEETLKVMEKLAELAGAELKEKEQKDRQYFFYRGSDMD